MVRGLGGVMVEFSPPTSEATGSNLEPGASCWKVGSWWRKPVHIYCTVNHRASASNYQLSNIKRPARDSNRWPQRLEARTLPLHHRAPFFCIENKYNYEYYSFNYYTIFTFAYKITFSSFFSKLRHCFRLLLYRIIV